MNEVSYIDRVCQSVRPQFCFGIKCSQWVARATEHCAQLVLTDDGPLDFPRIWRSFLTHLFPRRRSEWQVEKAKIPMGIYPSQLTPQDCKIFFEQMSLDYLNRQEEFQEEKYFNHVFLCSLCCAGVLLVFLLLFMLVVWIKNQWQNQIANITGSSHLTNYLGEKFSDYFIEITKEEEAALQIYQFIQTTDVISANCQKNLILNKKDEAVESATQTDFSNEIYLPVVFKDDMLYDGEDIHEEPQGKIQKEQCVDGILKSATKLDLTFLMSKPVGVVSAPPFKRMRTRGEPEKVNSQIPHAIYIDWQSKKILNKIKKEQSADHNTKISTKLDFNSENHSSLGDPPYERTEIRGEPQKTISRIPVINFKNQESTVTLNEIINEQFVYNDVKSPTKLEFNCKCHSSLANPPYEQREVRGEPDKTISSILDIKSKNQEFVYNMVKSPTKLDCKHKTQTSLGNPPYELTEIHGKPIVKNQESTISLNKKQSVYELFKSTIKLDSNSKNHSSLGYPPYEQTEIGGESQNSISRIPAVHSKNQESTISLNKTKEQSVYELIKSPTKLDFNSQIHSSLGDPPYERTEIHEDPQKSISRIPIVNSKKLQSTTSLNKIKEQCVHDVLKRAIELACNNETHSSLMSQPVAIKGDPPYKLVEERKERQETISLIPVDISMKRERNMILSKIEKEQCVDHIFKSATKLHANNENYSPLVAKPVVVGGDPPCERTEILGEPQKTISRVPTVNYKNQERTTRLNKMKEQRIDKIDKGATTLFFHNKYHSSLELKSVEFESYVPCKRVDDISMDPQSHTILNKMKKCINDFFESVTELNFNNENHSSSMPKPVGQESDPPSKLGEVRRERQKTISRIPVDISMKRERNMSLSKMMRERCVDNIVKTKLDSNNGSLSPLVAKPVVLDIPYGRTEVRAEPQKTISRIPVVKSKNQPSMIRLNKMKEQCIDNTMESATTLFFNNKFRSSSEPESVGSDTPFKRVEMREETQKPISMDPQRHAILNKKEKEPCINDESDSSNENQSHLIVEGFSPYEHEVRDGEPQEIISPEKNSSHIPDVICFNWQAPTDLNKMEQNQYSDNVVENSTRSKFNNENHSPIVGDPVDEREETQQELQVPIFPIPLPPKSVQMQSKKPILPTDIIKGLLKESFAIRRMEHK